MITFDTSLTLEELENNIWDKVPYNSYVIKSCYEARKIPVENLTSEQMRLLLGQKQSLSYIVPLALNKLTDNPWESGDMYDGALLVNILRIDKSFWQGNQNLYWELYDIMTAINIQQETLKKEIFPSWYNIENL